MSRLRNFLWVMAFAVGLLPRPGAAQVATVHSVNPYLATFEPVTKPEKAGPVTMKFECEIVGPDVLCDELQFTVETFRGITYHGPRTWQVLTADAKPYSTTLEIEIPDGDTSSISITIKCGRVALADWAYFVTTGESVEVWKGPPSKRGYEPDPVKLDSTKYLIRLDLRDSTRLDFFLKYEEQVGPLIPTDEPGFYLFKSTREMIRELRMERFWLEPMEEIPGVGPPDTTITPESDSQVIPGERGEAPDTTKRGSGRIWLDHVHGMNASYELNAGQEITFVLGLENNTGAYLDGIRNDFRIYSPDGAEWGQLSTNLT